MNEAKRSIVLGLAALLALGACACDTEDGTSSGPGGDADADGDTDTDTDTDADSDGDGDGDLPFDITGMEWANVPGGLDVPTFETFADKVVFVNCFQAWCPGCHYEGIPLHKAVNAVYADEPHYLGLYMQTVFEGYSTNTYSNGLSVLTNDFDIVDPFYAFHPGEEPHSPHFMEAFDVLGTPWSVLFGRDGEVIASFVSYDYSYYELQEMIDEALDE